MERGRPRLERLEECFNLLQIVNWQHFGLELMLEKKIKILFEEIVAIVGNFIFDVHTI